jgi:hypothetical protein
MKKLVFTFGTLYEQKIISALLGAVPHNFLAKVEGYAVYQGKAADAPEEIRQELLKKWNLDEFTFLYAKKVVGTAIFGKAYEIDTDQELILDYYEKYPNWYRKEDIEIIDTKEHKHEGYMYAYDKGGKRVDSFERVQGDLNMYIKIGKEIQKKVLNTFPSIKRGNL